MRTSASYDSQSARGLAGAAVDDEVLGVLGDLGVEVVHQHPQRRLGLPRPRGQLGAVGGVDGQAGVAAGHCEFSDHGLRRRRGRRPTRDELDGGLDLGREVAVGPGALDAGRPQQARRRRRSPATARAGARRSSARAAVSTSIATTRVSPSTERRSLRAADQPIETWSSCMALDGIESTRGRDGEPLELGDDRGLGVLRDHVAAVDARVVGEERRQAVAARPCRGTGRYAAR